MKSGHGLIEDDPGRNDRQNRYLAVSENDAPSSKMGISLGRWRFVTGFYGVSRCPMAAVSASPVRKEIIVSGMVEMSSVPRYTKRGESEDRHEAIKKQWTVTDYPFAATFFSDYPLDYPLTCARPRSSTGWSGMVGGAIGAESSPRKASGIVAGRSSHGADTGLQFDLAVFVKTCQRNVKQQDSGFMTQNCENFILTLYEYCIYIYGWSCQSLCCQGSFRRLRDMRRYIYIYIPKLTPVLLKGHRSILYMWHEWFQATQWSPRNRNGWRLELTWMRSCNFLPPRTHNFRYQSC